MRTILSTAAIAAALVVGTPPQAGADAFRAVTDRSQFVSLVSGRTLSYPGVRLQVTTDGQISGRGLGIKVTGAWQWQGDYFCRDLYWGDRELGANCQQVLANGDTLRFISDRGTGQQADLRLR